MFFDTEIFYDAFSTHHDGVVSDVVLYEEIVSTSTALMKRMSARAVSGTVVLAARQTGGRGRTGNSWHSAHDRNLYISYAIQISGDIASRLPLIPLVAGVAAFEALGAVGVSDVLLKWPNDLMSRGKKVGGILCETPGVENDRAMAVVGMGINIGAQTFPDELAEIATFLTPPDDENYFRERLSAHWIESLYRWCQIVQSDSPADLIGRWKQCCEPFGRYVRVGTVMGYTLDLNEAGRLLIKTDSGEICTIPGGMVEHLD